MTAAVTVNEPIQGHPDDIGGSIKIKLEDIFGRASEAGPLYAELGGIEGVMRTLKSGPDGIDPATVAYRQQFFGRNELPEDEPITFFQILLAAWSDHMILILTAAAILSLILGLTLPEPGHTEVDRSKGWIEGFAIIVSVLLVTTVSSVNDYRKELKFRQLTDENKAQDVRVIRGGEERVIDVAEIVVGDILSIGPGLVTPTDGFYLKGDFVVIDESAVTGENDPKRKDVNRPFVLSGTVVNTAENAWVLVGAVGENSFGGKLLMGSRSEGGPRPTPLQERLDDMADLIGKFGIAAATTLFATLSIIEFVRLGNGDGEPRRFLDYFLICVAIVVVAVPEGLPLAVTISLAYSQNKMRQDNNQVRRLKACETMGNATQICSDKTGTLTKNQMSVVQYSVGAGHFAVERPGDGFEKIVPEQQLHLEVIQLLAEALSLCSTSEKSLKPRENGSMRWVWALDKGNKTDNALLDFADRLLVEPTDETELKSLPHQRLRAAAHQGKFAIFPFTSDRKKMSVVVKKDNGTLLHFVKGGSDVILPLCDQLMLPNGEVVPLKDDRVSALEKQILSFANEANRTVGVAFAKLGKGDPPADEPSVALTWLCLIGIQDPLRDEVKEAVAKCQSAGVTVRMCTGDNLNTAIAISKQCGIYDRSRGDIAVEGKQFREMVYDAYEEEINDGTGQAAFTPILLRTTVLARSQPLDKQLLVLMLMLRGEVVAVTGDGTNDAPALKLANVGFVMKSGTDIAVKSADIVLLDDNFRSVQRAVVWGRTVNDNIRKFLQLQLTVNIVSVLLTFIGSVSNTSDNASPLSTVQLLWINLIMDTFGALALATEEPSEACLNRGPVDKHAPLVSRRMWCTMLCQALYQLLATLLVLHLGHKWFQLAFDESVANTTFNNVTNQTVILGYYTRRNDGKGSTRHLTIVFNIFVWCVLLNQFNARKLYDELNVFEGFERSKFFFVVLTIEVTFQAICVELFGSFMQTESLTGYDWLGCLCIAILVIPLGVLSRFIPIVEPKLEREFDPDDIDPAAKDMLQRLNDDIKIHLEARAAEKRKHADALHSKRMSSPSMLLWRKVKAHHVTRPVVVRAFRRAHREGLFGAPTFQRR